MIDAFVKVIPNFYSCKANVEFTIVCFDGIDVIGRFRNKITKNITNKQTTETKTIPLTSNQSAITAATIYNKTIKLTRTVTPINFQPRNLAVVSLLTCSLS